MAVDITQLLSFAVKNNASDLHLSAGVPPIIRVDGDVKRINMPALTHKEVHSMVYDIMNDKQRKDYEDFLETDFSFEIPNFARCYQHVRQARSERSDGLFRRQRRWVDVFSHGFSSLVNGSPS